MTAFLALLMTVPTGLAGGAISSAPMDGAEAPGANPEGVLWTRYGPMDLRTAFGTVPMVEGDLDSRFWVVQFDGPIAAGTSDVLAFKGIHVVGYFPDDAYVVHCPTGPPDLDGIDNVAGTMPFLSGFKMDPALLEQFRIDGRRSSVFGCRELVVDSFLPDPTVLTELAGISSRAVPASDTRTVVRLPVADLDSLLSIDGVRSIEPMYPIELHNNASAGIIGIPYVWSTMGLTGRGQTVAISDTGLDTGKDNHSVNGDIMADFDNRVAFANWAGTSPDDTHGHGTHVAGSVAGDGSLSSGRIKGMAPKANIFFQGIADDSGYLTGLPANLSQLFKQAYDNGARIHTNSWGSSVAGQYTSYSRDVDWFLFNYPEMMILFSAGNSGVDYYKPYPTYNPDGKVDDDSLGSPSTSKDCLTIGAGENLRLNGGYQFPWGTGWASRYSVEPIKSDKVSNNPYGMAAFSSRGPTDDGRIKPDVFAPGTNILSDRSTKTSSTGWGPFSGNANYIFMGGTSMSTPITAGALALIREYYNVTLGMDRPSGALLKATLINGAQDMTPGQYASTGTTQEVLGRPDTSQGWGRINITNSLSPKDMHLAFIDRTVGIVTGQNVTTELKVNGGRYLNLTLAWSDYPGELYAAKELVNDLDLELTAPDGSKYRGNDLSSPFDDTWDRKNPVEVIQIKNPASGTWKVRVHGYTVPMGAQRFALVATGQISNFTGIVSLDRNYYSTDGDRINIDLIDQDLIGKGKFTVNVVSGSSPSGRSVVLDEVGASGRFTGYVRTINTTTTNVSYLFVSNDDTITAKYTDQSPSVTVLASATAKTPKRVLLTWRPEFGLVQAEGEGLLVQGKGDSGTDAMWTLSGLPIGNRRLHDDGNTSQRDPAKDDGNYSALWYVPSGVDGVHRIIVIVNDPFLGIRAYEDYPLTFNSTMPRFPKDLVGEVVPEGNTVVLNWSASNETDLAFYTVLGKTSTGALDDGGWTIILNTTGLAEGAVVTDLVDGADYILTVAVTDASGVRSDTAVPVRITPADTIAPQVQIVTSPCTLVGKVKLSFSGDADLGSVSVEYWNDTNGNGMPDDAGSMFVPIGSGPASSFVWDTRAQNGGPGDVPMVILRFRGYDEVPNISPYAIVGGFTIDNTGPLYLSIDAPDPPRVTNEPDQSYTGTGEPNGWVHVFLNGAMIDNASVDGTGSFLIGFTLSEGRNVLNLSAYDQNGAGPTNVSYNITLDTTAPEALIEGGSAPRTIEIGHEAVTFRSISQDAGADPEFARIDNTSWTLRTPSKKEFDWYGDAEVNITFQEFGDHTLVLRVRDPAGNSQSSVVMINVTDGTAPLVNISGSFTVNEDLAVRYDTSGTFDNDPFFRTRPGASYLWLFTGIDFEFNSTEDVVFVAFEEPGTYEVTLLITDGANNTGGSTKRINVTDVTAPSGNILGPSSPILGDVSEYIANVTDNDPSFPDGAQMSWELGYRDGPIEQQWTIYFNGTDRFTYTYLTGGIYYLTLTVTDASGNANGIGLAISAIGDITDPKVLEVLPTANSSFQFPEDQIFSVKFSEPMEPLTVTNATVHLDHDGTPVRFLLELKDGGTRAVLTPSSKLQFEWTYEFVVEPTIADLWDNKIGRRYVQNYTVRTLFSLDFPDGVFPSSTAQNFSSDDNITLRFTNPVTPTSVHIEVRTVKGTKTNVPISVFQGEDQYTLLVDGDLDPGLDYEVTVFKDSVDVYGYSLDMLYLWNIKTYIPPTTPEPHVDEDEPSYWWVYVIIAAVTLLLMLIVAVAIVLRIRHNAKLRRLWMEGGEGGRVEERRREEEEALRRRVQAGTMAEGATELPDIADLDVGPPEPQAASSFLDYATASPAEEVEEESWEE